MTQDKGVAASPPGHQPSASAVPASQSGVPNALYTHNHAGWRKHDLPDSEECSLLTALIGTHQFLAEYQDQYRVEIKRTPEYSYDGRLVVYWDSDTPKTFVFGEPLWRGDFWFTAFEFNVAPQHACRYCGGSGMDHYTGPFEHCWACDGSGVQVRTGTWRGFKKKPTKHAPEKFHREYADWQSAQAMSTGTAKTPKAVEGRSPASAVPDRECAQPTDPSETKS